MMDKENYVKKWEEKEKRRRDGEGRESSQNMFWNVDMMAWKEYSQWNVQQTWKYTTYQILWRVLVISLWTPHLVPSYFTKSLVKIAKYRCMWVRTLPIFKKIEFCTWVFQHKTQTSQGREKVNKLKSAEARFW